MLTDGELVRAITRIYRLNEDVRYLLDEVVINHPNGQALCSELHDNGLGYSIDCAAIAHSHLMRPERWERVDGGRLRRKTKQKGESNAE